MSDVPWKRKEVIGDCTLYLGDCRDVMPTLGVSWADCAFTDPPYRVISGGTSSKLAGGWKSSVLSKNDGKIFDHNDIGISEYLDPLFLALKHQSHAYVMTNNLNLHDLLDASKAIGFRMHNLLVWVKNNCTANRWYMKNLEYTVFLFKGAAMPINDMSSKQTFFCANPTKKVHPTEKPVALAEHYILNSTQRGQTVFDPFMGSGSCGLAAVKSGRKFVGIEKDDHYFDVACRRISLAVNISSEIQIEQLSILGDA